MTRSALALLLLAGCGPYVGPTAGTGWRWRHEPTVGTASPALAPLVEHAVEAWGYGRAVPSCVGADVCVIASGASRAGPVGRRCIAEVAIGGAALEQPPEGVALVAEHEIGHCYGLGHSADPEDVMFPTPTHGVSDADRAVLRAGVTATARAAARSGAGP